MVATVWSACLRGSADGQQVQPGDLGAPSHKL